MGVLRSVWRRARCVAGFHTSSASLPASILLVALALAAAPAFAGSSADLCPADTSGGKILSCTSQDISIAEVRAKDGVGNPTICLVGEQIDLFLEVAFATNAASDSFDIGTWFAQDGGNLLIPSAQGGAASCTSIPLPFPIDGDPPGEFPDLVDDLDGDACGDVRGEKGEQFTTDFGEATVGCDGAVGGAEIDAIVSWHERNNPVCSDTSDPNDYGGFNTSKCNLSTTFFDLEVYGRLTILKAASTSDVEFGYTSTGVVDTSDLETPIVEFTLLSNGAGQELAALLGEPVTVTEAVFPDIDWGLVNISCVNNDPRAVGVPVVFSRDGNSLLITLTEGNLATDPEPGAEDYGQSDVTCTFTNSQGGSITIIKDAQPNSAQDFAYTGDLGAFTLDDDQDPTHSNTAVFDELEPGSYSVAETPVAGWDLASIDCSEDVALDNGGVTIDIEAGDDVVCTFTNVQRGGIVIAKQTEPDGDPQTFDFSGDLSGTIGDGQTLSASDLVPGDYSVTEAVPAGWALTSIVCDDGNSSGDLGTATANIVVDPGEVVTCTFINTRDGSISVELQLEPPLGDTFTFSGDLSGTIGDGGTISAAVQPGSYSTSLDPADIAARRWTLTSISCDDDDSSGDLASATANYSVGAGEDVHCVFTLTRWSSITVVKNALGFEGEFCFQQTDPSQNVTRFCLATQDGNAETFIGDDLETGTWSFIEETDQQGQWSLVSDSCGQGRSAGSFELGPGEDVVCTFVNGLHTPVPASGAWSTAMLMLGLFLTGLWAVRRRYTA